MRHDVMMEMSNEQLDQYGEVCGIDVSGKRTKAEKVALIEELQDRAAEIDVLGMTVAIPKRRLHDKRIQDLVAGKRLEDEEVAQAFRSLLGDEQYAEIIERCTNDDGTVDGDAYAIAFAQIMTNADLKNY